MLMPRKQKYRKQFRGTMKGNATRGLTLAFGEYGLSSKETGWVSSKQIEAARRTIAHYTQRGGRTWIRIFPDKPVSKKPPEVRMGGGKGDVHEFVAVVKPGRMLFEMSGVSGDIAKQALKLASYKLPVKTKIIVKGE
jgi:large subunit ribosomal protein L16